MVRQMVQKNRLPLNFPWPSLNAPGPITRLPAAHLAVTKSIAKKVPIS